MRKEKIQIKKLIIILVSLLTPLVSIAQNDYVLRGKVMDETGQPLQEASVILLNSADTALLEGTYTNAEGIFILNNIKQGFYKIKISYLGYATSVKNISIAASQKKIIHAGHIKLSPLTNTLTEVVITTHRNFMTTEGDKKVFDVAMMGGVASGTASDVMRQIPLVDVDMEGNVTLRGKQVNILIDGKPSPFSDITTALEMIPSSSIDKVEVMTNPSAKYDAEGQGGIINIVLKKDKAKGYNGILNLDVATQPDYHSGTDFNIRKKRLNIFGNLNYHTRRITAYSNSNRQYLSSDSNYSTNQINHTGTKNKDLDTRLGFDYSFNDKTSLTFTQAFSDRNAWNNAAISLDSANAFKPSYSYGSRNNQVRNQNLNYNTTLNFTKQFGKTGEQLTADFMFANNNTTTHNNFITAYNNTGSFTPNPNWQQNTGNGNSKLLMLQADYEDPIKQGKLEAGYKSSFRFNQNNLEAYLYDNNSAAFEYNNNLSSHFSYNEQIHAAYATYANSIKKFHYKIGLRTELALLDGISYLQDIHFNKQFFSLFPSGYLSYDLPKNQNIGLSYSTRITRPGFNDLLPYTDNTDPANLKSGNPSLKPAYSHNIELNYSKLFSKSNDLLNVSFYYSGTSNIMQRITMLDSNGIALTRPENIATATSFGSDIIYRLNIKKKLHFTTTFNLRHDKFTGDQTTAFNRNGFWNWNIRLNGQLNLPHQFLLFARGDITSPKGTPQGYNNSNRGIDLELRKPFLHNKITAALIVSDIFNDRRDISHIVTPDFVQDDYHKETSRLIHLHFSYVFGKFDAPPPPKNKPPPPL